MTPFRMPRLVMPLAAAGLITLALPAIAVMMATIDIYRHT